MKDETEGKWLFYKNDQAYYSALLRNNQLEKLQIDPIMKHQIGEIYIGKIQKLMPNIQAAFVEISADTICYLPLHEKMENLRLNESKSKGLKEGDTLLVQIMQEAAKTKQATVSTELSLSGNYCVVSLGKKELNFSKKIPNRKKQELISYMMEQNLIDQQKQPIMKHWDYSVIIRTNAMDLTDFSSLTDEIITLSEKLKKITEMAQYRTMYSLLYEPLKPFLKVLQNSYTKDYSEIITDQEDMFLEISAYLKESNIQHTNPFLYQDQRISFHSLYSLETKMKEATQKKVWLKSGAYLLIEPTETLTVIDVNSGKYTGKGTKEDTFFKINMEACLEICRQLKLRNISGMILIDFINLSNEENQKELISTLIQQIKLDPITTTFIDITQLGLVELTRKRTTKSIYEQLAQLNTNQMES